MPEAYALTETYQTNSTPLVAGMLDMTLGTYFVRVRTCQESLGLQSRARNSTGLTVRCDMIRWTREVTPIHNHTLSAPSPRSSDPGSWWGGTLIKTDINVWCGQRTNGLSNSGLGMESLFETVSSNTTSITRGDLPREEAKSSSLTQLIEIISVTVPGRREEHVYKSGDDLGKSGVKIARRSTIYSVSLGGALPSEYLVVLPCQEGKEGLGVIFSEKLRLHRAFPRYTKGL